MENGANYDLIEKSSEMIFNLVYIMKNNTEVGGEGFIMFEGVQDIFQSQFYEDPALRIGNTVLNFETPYFVEFNFNKQQFYLNGTDYEALKEFANVFITRNTTEDGDIRWYIELRLDETVINESHSGLYSFNASIYDYPDDAKTLKEEDLVGSMDLWLLLTYVKMDGTQLQKFHCDFY